jgi:NTE family protein
MRRIVDTSYVSRIPAPDDTPKKIGLALSGGGVRAAIFHLGVLRRLAAEDLLGKVTHLSTVSGGSLVTAAIMARSGLCWPTSAQYEGEVYPDLRELLTSSDLFSLQAVGWSGLLRFNLKLLRHRARVLADLLERQWGVRGGLGDLPPTPVWWINTTCLLTGKNWRFARGEMGDWRFGLHYAPEVRIADAAAASAAVPYAIGALTLDLPREGWFEVDPATRRPTRRRERPTAERVRLWDGGAYENLGLEALYKPGEALRHCDFLICSDASGALASEESSSPLRLFRGKLASPRLFDVASDQIRSLRSRMLFRDIDEGTVRGALIKMGLSARDIDIKVGRSRSGPDYDAFQTDAETRAAHLHPTDLAAVSPEIFDLIARHGFEAADGVLTTHAPTVCAAPRAWRPTDRAAYDGSFTPSSNLKQ